MTKGIDPERPPCNKRGAYVIELDKERKDCKENPFLQNQWEENSNEEVVDGGVGDGRNQALRRLTKGGKEQ
jgi:hypothetical protein